MTYGYIRQFPVLLPKAYTTADIEFIAPRVLELVYTAWDTQPFAQDMGYAGPPFRWDEERRTILRAELDAFYAWLYGLNHKQLRYILDPADLTPAELEDILDPWEEVNDPLDPEWYASRVAASTFPGETFRVLKEKEIKHYGEYRTRRLVLEAWYRLAAVYFNVEEYVPTVDPPPAHPSVAHPNRDGSVYEGPGLVLDKETAIEIKTTPSQSEVAKKETREVENVSAEPKVERAVAGKESMQTSDYSLYKCKGCGQMVMGFDQDEHIRTLHGGKEQGFVRL